MVNIPCHYRRAATVMERSIPLIPKAHLPVPLALLALRSPS